MIQRRGPASSLEALETGVGGPVLAAIRTSGPDPAVDRITGLIALRPDGQGSYVRHEGPAESWDEFLAFLGESPVLCPDGEAFERWFDHRSGRPGAYPACLGLTELTALVRPRRGTTPGAGPTTPGDLEDLARTFAARVAGLLELGGEALALFSDGLRRACLGLAERDPRAAARLRLAHTVIDQPLAFCPLGSGLTDGRLEESWREATGPDEGDLDGLSMLLDDLSPACRFGEHQHHDPLPPRADTESAFHPEDDLRLESIFTKELPELFGGNSYREAQHAVAREVARSFGQRELLLVHAPTGTGKTLAYLLPALLWSLRYEVRVGVATYTRTLQEQAMDRDVPRALEALALAGVTGVPRVSMLKGRENYVCWRALRLAVPGEDDEPEVWLAWTQLLAFALTDQEADLDRLPVRPPVRLASERTYRALRGSFLSQARARSGCCTRREDRELCGGDQARRRAERSHVVVTNHAFALARQEFLRRVVFDECEHLHDQAHSAFSATLTLREARSVLARVHRSDRKRSRAPLDRLAQQLLPGSPSHEYVADAIDVWDDVRLALLALEDSAKHFESWRADARRERGAADEHSLLREYLADEVRSEGLVVSRRNLGRSLARLDATLAELAERLDRMPVRGAPRIRRGLELARQEVGELGGQVEAWLPLQEGRPALRRETFYDVERDPRGDLTLAARVLLPNEYLGRFYYPNLEGAVLMSATTYMSGSFDGARGYLGLDRAEQVADEDDPDREPMPVRTFRAPEAFDYGRVLVCTPRDAPPVNTDKDGFLDYLRQFLAYLGERTGGRMLVLFTNTQDVRRMGEALAGFFRARDIPLYWQGMEEAGKEELSANFRERPNSILLGVDTFWYGADFPGDTLQYLVMVRLPYGVPDRYHHAQCAAIGVGNQRKRIYQPRAMAKFRQGFGRLMRRHDDRGVVFLMDARITTPQHRHFLRELPVARGLDQEPGLARIVRGDTDRCLKSAFAHMGLMQQLRDQGQWTSMRDGVDLGPLEDDAPVVERKRPEPPPMLDVADEDLPF